MNTKEIIAYVRTNTVTNFSDVADALMADAKKLIEVRKCHTNEAKKSCYEEQITKYRSAFAKARPEMEAHGWTEDAMSNYLKSHKDSKAIMAPPPVQEHRHTHTVSQDAIKRLSQISCGLFIISVWPQSYCISRTLKKPSMILKHSCSRPLASSWSTARKIHPSVKINA